MFLLRSLASLHCIRNAQREYLRFAWTRKDPGISNRRKGIPLESEEMDEVDFENLETDFMNVHKSHKLHLDEMALRKEQEKYRVVQQKYFKEKFPNFLTWHDKEQIRYLHNTDPEEWTVDKLSEGFPALPDTIAKIIKSNWTKTKQNKITNHDHSVQKNWKMYKSGKMTDLPKPLSEHLQKFTNRALNLRSFELKNHKATFEVNVTQVGNEFSEIITSYERLKKKKTNDELPRIEAKPLRPPPQSDTYLKGKPRGQPVTLAQLQDQTKLKISSGRNFDEQDKLIAVNLEAKPTVVDGSEKGDIADFAVTKYQSSGSSVTAYVKKTERDMSHLSYPEKINIPKDILKKGSTYKLNDCFYDDNGEFLYRVPGMG